MNARDVRVYVTDFSKYYHALRKYHAKYGGEQNKKQKKKKSHQKSIPAA
eukprot:CAMPEP_0202722208 /NCGR_PEP_ID=MMETSP1385-20130828/155520_1 /ASSEMBLY_ACC=CAM_ASM_000861 /TAXON_ID=933848 /ORGANISM="Elphidium margaritaceum" /LENGTH=48 /DNA_ID= /DNA_START= /DNA_END= /DNA_ORIENTATION=